MVARLGKNRKAYKPRDQIYIMTNPMDRGFGDNPIRQSEKSKISRQYGKKYFSGSKVDIEEPIAPQP